MVTAQATFPALTRGQPLRPLLRCSLCYTRLRRPGGEPAGSLSLACPQLLVQKRACVCERESEREGEGSDGRGRMLTHLAGSICL